MRHSVATLLPGTECPLTFRSENISDISKKLFSRQPVRTLWGVTLPLYAEKMSILVVEGFENLKQALRLKPQFVAIIAGPAN
jgi:hypothetical protein